jgi:hypothetical protein
MIDKRRLSVPESAFGIDFVQFAAVYQQAESRRPKQRFGAKSAATRV